MKLSASKAAKETGKSIPTITRAIKSGKLSAEKQPDGGYLIDAAELFRVFDPVTSEGNETPSMLGIETPLSDRALQGELETLRERLRMTEAERDRERLQLTDQIDDLRRRLDDESSERRKLTMMLTDQTARPAPPVAVEAPKRFWWPFRRSND